MMIILCADYQVLRSCKSCLKYALPALFRSTLSQWRAEGLGCPGPTRFFGCPPTKKLFLRTNSCRKFLTTFFSHFPKLYQDFSEFLEKQSEHSGIARCALLLSTRCITLCNVARVAALCYLRQIPQVIVASSGYRTRTITAERVASST